MTATNPLLADWTTPFALPPFDLIRASHFAPAFEAAMQAQRAEVEAIAANADAPDFDNTVAAFDRSGRLLSRIEAAFHALAASHTSPDIQAVQRELAAPLAAHDSAVMMHAGLFARLDAVHAKRHEPGLSPEQLRLVERLHVDFVRAGAKLGADKQPRYAQIMERLAQLTTRFAQNVLADEAGFQLELSDDELDGLPPFVRASARQAASDRGLAEGTHVVTLSRSLIVPFLTFSTRRELRERAWKAWVGRGENEGETDNREVARDILRLRQEQAWMHGHASYAEYALANTMAGNVASVNTLLDDVYSRALAALQDERKAVHEALRDAGVAAPYMAWDWRYGSEKVRQQRYAFDDGEVKPYFSLDRMVQAAFDCAHRLFGIRMVRNDAIPVYHPDVVPYEVWDDTAPDSAGTPNHPPGGARPGSGAAERGGRASGEGRLIGIFLHDNFARQTKRSGAWMSSLRLQSRNGPVDLPVIMNNNNFAKGAPGEPTLLSFDDARTLFHEFGHGLHGLLSNVTYQRLSGTNVLRDFVELPSQLYEHWLLEPEVIARHARHWQTGEPIPETLVRRLQESRRWGQAYETVRYAGSALVDMAVHSRTDKEPPADLPEFEAATLARLNLPPEVGVNHRLLHFQHLFSGSAYAAGYYVYLWAEVLDADAFDAFKEAGSAFDPVTAARLRQCIYGAGDSVAPQQAYAAFRGRMPSIEPLLRKRGLLPEDVEY
ncbi:M3 family metallopeptidase [Scleromatobacter humisilvae]|uniref:M3 family metallopeptidase n=1 Tax=Scleromatobacter humisilvae TaxID=2897159 RepID=A0A9X1YE74_9BURK|nr:M3 family metallopeptidase [Scleromatobacter humisilvae]MCK9684353.1 M3 family metallopeptidase [Scleromatobacter humisilvae]